MRDHTSTNVRDLLGGWLCFESATEKRRLPPIPRNWESASEERLNLLCRVATEAYSDRRGNVSSNKHAILGAVNEVKWSGVFRAWGP